MAGRSPLRFLAPIALLAVAFALYTIVKQANEPAGKPSSVAPAARSGTPATKAGSKKSSKKGKRRVYIVKAGDTASGIANRTGVSIETMQKLNKNFNPQTLSPGQRIRLSG